MSVEIKDIENVVIVGSGPAGYTAALYTARADLEPLVIEGFAWGGLLQQTTDVENYPGYPEGVMGPEMMQDFRDQAERFGTRFITDDATRIELSPRSGGIHRVTVGGQEIRARAVILAMGAEPKKLGVPGEDELSARGVSYCATCDAAFFRDARDDRGRRRRHRHGGRHLPGEVRRQGEHRPPPAGVPRLGDHARPRAATPRTSSCVTPYVVRALRAGRERVARARPCCENTEDGSSGSCRSPAPSSRSATSRTRSSSRASSTPTTRATSWWRGAPRAPKLPGVFAAGDLTDHVYRQAVTAAGTGCMAALDAEAYLRDTPIDPEAHWAPDPDEGRSGRGARGSWRRTPASELPETWTNWARHQRCAPERIERPASEAELVARWSRARARVQGGRGRATRSPTSPAPTA